MDSKSQNINKGKRKTSQLLFSIKTLNNTIDFRARPEQPNKKKIIMLNPQENKEAHES